MTPRRASRLLAAVIVLLGVLWVRSLARALVTTDTSTGSSRVRNAVLPLARYGLRGAVAARFLRYQRRDPASLAYWAIVVVIMFICCASTIFGQQQHPAVVDHQRGLRRRVRRRVSR